MIDINKKYKTRDGRDVRIISTNLNNRRYPIVAALDTGSGGEEVITYTEYGRYHTSESNYDLVEVKQKKKVWIEIFESPDTGDLETILYEKENTAKNCQCDASIKLIETEIEI